MTVVLSLSAFWITRSLCCINSFKDLHSDSVKLVLSLSKFLEFKVGKQTSLSLFLRKLCLSDMAN